MERPQLAVVSEDALQALTGAVWRSLAGLETRPAAADADVEGALTAMVHFTGEWEGVLILDVTPGLARQAMARMTGASQDELPEEELYDMVAEVSNILSASLLPRLPRPCETSHPRVERLLDDRRRTAAGEPVAQVRMACEGHALRVTLLKRR
ncbi:MAG: chemotaxis protein CheX [Candidatus Eisenbacteria bacterium]|nr:chemotaxis protein CheX [Candidatus Eisenbacteria bacterium]